MPRLVGRALRREWERMLSKYKNKRELYHFSCNVSEIDFIDIELEG